jgi:broad specificity phosphatase PhoE
MRRTLKQQRTPVNTNSHSSAGPQVKHVGNFPPLPTEHGNDGPPVISGTWKDIIGELVGDDNLVGVFVVQPSGSAHNGPFVASPLAEVEWLNQLACEVPPQGNEQWGALLGGNLSLEEKSYMLQHLRVWRHVIDNDLDYAVVMESDMPGTVDAITFNAAIETSLEKLGVDGVTNVVQLQTGVAQQPTNKTPRLKKGVGHGTGMYVVTQDGARSLSKHFLDDAAPLLALFKKEKRVYHFSPGLVTGGRQGDLVRNSSAILAGRCDDFAHYSTVAELATIPPPQTFDSDYPACDITVLMVRHGERADTQADVAKTFDPKVTDKGLKHAVDMASSLAASIGKDQTFIDKVYSSPLARAIVTAEPFAKQLQLPLEIVDPLATSASTSRLVNNPKKLKKANWYNGLYDKDPEVTYVEQSASQNATNFQDGLNRLARKQCDAKGTANLMFVSHRESIKEGCDQSCETCMENMPFFIPRGYSKTFFDYYSPIAHEWPSIDVGNCGQACWCRRKTPDDANLTIFKYQSGKEKMNWELVLPTTSQAFDKGFLERGFTGRHLHL